MVRQKSSGFTLIEILVAITIFAIVSVVTYASMNNIFNNKQTLEKLQDEFEAIHKAVAVLERDILQIVPRAVRNDYGGFEPAFVSDGISVKFTKTGRVNLAGLKQSNMQRLSYSLQGDKLMRQSWSTLDRADNSEVEVIELLAKVKSFKVEVFDFREYRWSDGWPLSEAGALIELDDVSLPKFVRFNLEVENFGTITRILPGVG